ncbi:DUF481 domain-containing protein [Nitratiruptor tergarcus]|uniref:Putative salt-induced outer membrane protein n=1 Tax=Nitratiruptor tergarcus DSM 16512 TaxID=1069081 RepID=A0A1W1WRJ0_9BACT|nr:DUF481 domain-containing protein [Nitratiruptor tergarcus]SMC08839.1 putative salt-induced outer membrane protein [Nitratiruptor tergarcus DSM 16512]
MKKVLLIFVVPFIALAAPQTKLRQKVEFGYFGTTGNSNTNSITAAYRFSYKFNKKSRCKFFADILYSNRNGQTNNERYRSEFTLYHYYRKHLYSFLELGFLRNTFEGYNQQYSFNPGFGFLMLKTKKQKLDILAGYELRRNNYTNQPSDFFHYIKGEIQHHYRLTKKNSIKTKLSFIENLQEREDFESNLETSLRLHIIKRLSFKISFELKYDNLPPAGKKNTDTVTKAAIVYNF